MRILITDDDQVCSQILLGILSPYGTCQLAEGGEQAIRMFTNALVRKKPYDLVCLDILMPDMDGHATLSCIRSIEAGFGIMGSAGVRILMVTTRDDPENITTAFRRQCEGYIIKPIDEDQVKKQLGQLRMKSFHKIICM